ncbi:SDR family NAD(P)-dependent oxidoreductase [Agrococcus sp. SL85]|uniref:SDR family NAD(P)-dependent oxidoreductase n=1 Tax=Agrococcus sp. SL85 TaxID=2995141 RepID=UPI00226D0EBF|nr:SDR family oxidoreductase [Agrococcus sp. SL85]WAC65559.1 SDR family NAD(P)-dependent oxidoreductase [Agrococcus sp. SL85]
MQIAQRTFVVTGGGNGIGREVVLALLARGARVAAVDLSAEGLAETARLAGIGDRLSTHVASVADRAAVEALPEAVVAAHGQVDGLLNVAGIIQPFQRIGDLPYEQIERVMQVNFWGVVHTTMAFLPHLRARSESALLNVSSMGALAPVPGQSAYGASKAAVKLLTEGMHAELEGTGVAVTVVFPGGVGTNITGNSGVTMRASADTSAAAATMTTPQAAAAQIVDAIASGAPRVVIGKDARALDRLARLVPAKVGGIIAKRMQGLLD